MKRTICKALGILLALCMTLCLAACGAQNAAGGLGTLDMDDGENGPGGIGTLGEPSQTTEPTGPIGTNGPTAPAPTQDAPAPNDGYAVFSSKQQDFSFLYDKSYTSVWSEENGATIYTQSANSIPYLLVYRNSYGDTTGFDISNYFYSQVEIMKEQYGSRLLSVSEAKTLTVGDKQIPGVIFTYTVDQYTVEMFLLLDDNGESLVQYTCKYIQGEGEPTMQALARAVATYQPDAAYYANGDSGTGAPAPRQNPQQTPKPAALSTEPYECKYFTVTKPSGWEVFYEEIDAGGGAKRIYAFVYDPANPNNMFFFAQVLEPFYVSESAKKAWLPYMPAYYSSAPIISGDPSAEATLRVWGNAFSLMSAEGSKPSTYFRNYQLSEVIESKQISSSATSGTTSCVLGTVSIPGAKEQSLMLFQNTLVLMGAPTGLPSSAKYYASHGNNGVVLSLSTAGSQFDTVLACLQSFNFQASADSNSAQGGVKGSRVAVPETDVSSLY